jgi:hypothetical protein
MKEEIDYLQRLENPTAKTTERNSTVRSYINGLESTVRSLRNSIDGANSR